MRVAVLFALTALIGSTTANAEGRHAKWSAVEQLVPGAQVVVQSGTQAGPDACVLESADDAALTCVREDQAATRLVIPKASVRDLWLMVPGPDHHPWLRMGIGFSIGALLCGPIGPGPLFICGGIGALIGAAYSLGDHPLDWFTSSGPWGPPPPPSWHRRLVYRVSP